MFLCAKIRSLDDHIYPEKLKAIAQQVHEQHTHTPTLLRLQQQQQHGSADRESHGSRSPQVLTYASLASFDSAVGFCLRSHWKHMPTIIWVSIKLNGNITCRLFQVLAPPTHPAPTNHPTVIVPAPVLSTSHHATVVTMGPASVINTASTSRQNLDTIVQVGFLPSSLKS